MDEQLITQTLNLLQKLEAAGAFDNMTEPGKQTLVIYGLLSAMIIALIRIFLINGWLKKGIERFFQLEETKVQSLKDLNEKVVNLQNQVIALHDKLYDALQLLHAHRKSDKIS